MGKNVLLKKDIVREQLDLDFSLLENIGNMLFTLKSLVLNKYYSMSGFYIKF